MKNNSRLISLFVLGLGLVGAFVSAGCQGGEAPADTSGVKTPDQAAQEGLPTPEAATGAGGGGGAGAPSEMSTAP